MTDRDGEDQAFVDAISEWPDIDDGAPTLAAFLLARIAEDEYRVRNSPYPRDAAECEAKRRIVELHPRVRYGEVGGECECCGADVWRDVADQYPCGTLRALALPYADHPAYRPEWRP